MGVPKAEVGPSDLNIENVIKDLRSGKLNMGGNVAKFENTIAGYLGVNQYMVVNSGSPSNPQTLNLSRG
jgi:dTDP-4-amino-4,6-dideoxygalactose transaminase